MKAKQILFMILAIFGLNQFIVAQVPVFQWAKRAGGVDTDRGHSITTDASGNVFTTGFFGGTVDFDPGPGSFTLTSAGVEDIFISKTDPLGNFVWAKCIGDTFYDEAKSIALDLSGNVYTTGFFFGTVDFDPGPGTFTLSSSGLNDIFISKLDASGNFLWAKCIGDTSYDNGMAIALDPSGNVYFTGMFNGTVDFNPGAGVYTITSAGIGNDDIFISKLDASGNFVWAKSFGLPSGGQANGIDVDASGNVHTTGYFYGTGDFDPGAGTYFLSSAGSVDIYISKLDASGNFVWAKQIGGSGGTGIDVAFSIAVDATGNVHTTGFFRSTTVDFDPGPGTFNLNAVGNGGDVFVLKLDVNGNFVWAKKMGGNSSDYSYAIALDVSGNVYTTGYFQSTGDFDPGTPVFNLSSAGGNDIFISKLDPSGNFVWAKRIGGGLSDYGLAITLDVSDNIYLTGMFDGTVDFDPGTGTSNLTTAGFEDIYILKLKQCIQPAPPLDLTPATNKNICEGQATSLLASGTGTINWYSTLGGNNLLGAGAGFNTPTLNFSQTYFAETFSCAASASRTAISITVNVCAGLENDSRISNSFLSIYPNPFNASATLEFNSPITNAEIYIYNLVGQKINAMYFISDSKIQIERGNLSSGIYFFEVKQDLKVVTKGKFIVSE